MRRRSQSIFMLLALQMLINLSPVPAWAQDPAQQELLRLTGQQVSEEEILARLTQ